MPSHARVASIDIGTHTLLLLVAEVDGDRVKSLFEEETLVRLGEGLQKSGILLREAMERGHHALSRSLDHCRRLGVERIFAAGTSALREARNSGEFLSTVRERFGLSIEILSAEEEALCSFLAVARDLGNLGRPILVIDVGGGSTEFIEGKEDQTHSWISFPLGAVRFTEKFLTSDPVREAEWKAMEGAIRDMLTHVPRPKPSFLMVAVGGTGTTLASVELGLKEFDFEKIHHFLLTKEALRRQLHLYRSKPLQERKNVPGLPPARADVILAGAAILYAAMEELRCPSVMISGHGVRYGLLYRRLNLGKPISSTQG